MPFLTREDGEHFVIPSYRDTLSSKNKTQLKKDILLLSKNYGEYITLQKKGRLQVEVAFSPDIGYLLGETVWQHFNKPADMVYCEAIPNSKEVILVVVKDSSVYLDGSFPVESIAEELVVFLSQKNNFEIFVQGNVPISKESEDGKFNFELSSVKSFTVLDAPAFPALPLLKIYYLQPVEAVLRSQGIGVLPIPQIVGGIVVLVVAWMYWSHVEEKKAEEEAAKLAAAQAAPQINPYQSFYDTLNSPSPEKEVYAFLDKVNLFMTIPGWQVKEIVYTKGNVSTTAVSVGGMVQGLLDWAQANHVTVGFTAGGMTLSTNVTVENRPTPTQIYPINDVLTRYLDKVAQLEPGTVAYSATIVPAGPIKQASLVVNFADAVPDIVAVAADLYKDMPFALQSMRATVNVSNGSLTGSITTLAVGN